MSTVPVNPYKPIYPVGDTPAFIGRADTLREVVKVLRRTSAHGVVLYGQRRIGKTSILRELLVRLPKIEQLHPVYFDLQDKAAWPLGIIVDELAMAIAESVGMPAPDLGVEPAKSFAQGWLPQFLHSQPPGRMVVLLLDEFGVLVDPKSGQTTEDFFPYLRGLLNFNVAQLKFVAVLSRSISELSTVALQLFKNIPALRVSLLPKPDTYELVRLSERNNTLKWSEDAIETVWELTNGHPLLTQLLCSDVWKSIYRESPQDLPEAQGSHVDAAVESALLAGQNSIEWLWNGLPSAGRVVVSALAEAGARPIHQEELEQILTESGVRVIIRELKEAPRLLQDWDLIEPGAEPYRFRVELLRRWILQKKPLARVKEELDYIEPLAENLYQAASRLYQKKQLEQAVALLQQAVEANPNHERASQLLADIQLSLGRVNEALQILDRLYEIRPFAVWPRIVRALITKAHSASSEEEKLSAYDRILELEPTHVEAQQGKKRIWRGRAEAALALNNLETALEAYRNAGMYEQAMKVETQARRNRLLNGLTVLKQIEIDKQYERALEFAQQMMEEYPEYNWGAILEQLRQKVKLAAQYRQGVTAVNSGDMASARRLLAQVAANDPEYEEVTRFLHKAVTGMDVVELQQALKDAQAALQVGEAGQALALLREMDDKVRLSRLFAAIMRGQAKIIGLPVEEARQANLVEKVVTLVQNTGFKVLRGACVQAANPSYAVWRPILRDLLGIDAGAPLEQQARELRRHLVAIDPANISFLSKVSLLVLDMPVPGSTVMRLMSPQELQVKVQSIIIDFLRRYAQKSPLLVIMESVNQIDRLSEELLLQLSKTIEELPVSVVLVYPVLDEPVHQVVSKMKTFEEIRM